MKLTIFGATGRAGRHLLEQALESGHAVTVFARNPQKLPLTHPQLRVVAGDLTDRAAVEAAVAGADAVLSTLGPAENKPVFAVSRGLENILAAMQQHGVRRLVVSAGAGVPATGDVPKLPDRLIGFLVRRLSRHVYEDMVRTVALVTASDREWTVVRVPMLTDDPPKGTVQVGLVGQGVGVRLSRADLAMYMLKQVDDKTQVGRLPVISN